MQDVGNVYKYFALSRALFFSIFWFLFKGAASTKICLEESQANYNIETKIMIISDSCCCFGTQVNEVLLYQEPYY